MGIIICCTDRKKNKEIDNELEKMKVEIRDENSLKQQILQFEKEIQSLTHLKQEEVNLMTKEQRLNLADKYAIRCKRGETLFLNDFLILVVFNRSGNMNYQEYSDYVHNVFKKQKRIANEQDIKLRFDMMNPNKEGLVDRKGIESFFKKKSKETKK